MTSAEAQQTQRLAELAEIRRQLPAARARLRSAAVEYAATPDGAAEMFRRYELAGSDEQRDALREIYLGGLRASAEEYAKRCALRNDTDGDGPVQAVPVGEFSDPLARALIEQRVMGSLRCGPSALTSGQGTVWLLRVRPESDSRKRLKLICPPQFGVFADPLSTVVADALADPATRQRVAEFVGPEVLAAADTARARRQP